MNSRSRLRATGRLVAALAVVATVVGCTSSSADGPTSTAVVSMTVTPSVVDPSSGSSTPSSGGPSPSAIDVSSPTPSPLDPAAQEAADRAAVEAAWAEFWTVTDGLTKVAEENRRAQVSKVAVEPTLSQALEQARSLDSKGREVYGESYFHPYWEQPIDGKSIAVMGDCTDTSRSGARDKETGEVRTVGVVDNNTRVTFVRGDDGVWRVEKIFYLVETPCP